MKKLFPLVCLSLISIAFTPVGYTAGDETKVLLRELVKLHGDIRLSLSGEQLLAQNTPMVTSLSKTDNATILAALEVLRRERVSYTDKPIALSQEHIAEVRNKIYIYKMLCMSAKPHPEIFSTYCEPPIYTDLLSTYLANVRNLASQ